MASSLIGSATIAKTLQDPSLTNSARMRGMANLSQIIDDLKVERERIDNAIRALTSLNGTAPKVSPRRTVSASVRRRIAAAQRARWARVKGTQSGARPTRRISAAGIARIRAAAKARWARVRAAKK